MSKRVLITGAGGAVARGALRELRAGGHFVRGLDLTEVEHADESHVGDVADHAAVKRAAEGMDVIIHLAATRDDAPFMEQLLQPNVVGLFNVMDAARHGSAKRVVLASSMQVLSGLRKATERVLTADDASPTNHYALTKVWAERMGDMYARCYGLTVIAARIGWLTRNKTEADRLAASTWGGKDSYFSPDDSGRFFRRCVEAELPPSSYHCLFAVSKPTSRQVVDIEASTRAIGYEPQDVFPQGLDFPWP